MFLAAPRCGGRPSHDNSLVVVAWAAPVAAGIIIVVAGPQKLHNRSMGRTPGPQAVHFSLASYVGGTQIACNGAKAHRQFRAKTLALLA